MWEVLIIIYIAREYLQRITIIKLLKMGDLINPSILLYLIVI